MVDSHLLCGAVFLELAPWGPSSLISPRSFVMVSNLVDFVNFWCRWLQRWWGCPSRFGWTSCNGLYAAEVSGTIVIMRLALVRSVSFDPFEVPNRLLNAEESPLEVYVTWAYISYFCSEYTRRGCLSETSKPQCASYNGYWDYVEGLFSGLLPIKD